MVWLSHDRSDEGKRDAGGAIRVEEVERPGPGLPGVAAELGCHSSRVAVHNGNLAVVELCEVISVAHPRTVPVEVQGLLQLHKFGRISLDENSVDAERDLKSL